MEWKRESISLNLKNNLKFHKETEKNENIPQRKEKKRFRKEKKKKIPQGKEKKKRFHKEKKKEKIP